MKLIPRYLNKGLILTPQLLSRLSELQNIYKNSLNSRSGDFVTNPIETEKEFLKRNSEYINTGNNKQYLKTSRVGSPVGLSGTDPVGKFVVTMVGLNAPSRYLGNLFSKTVGKLIPKVGRWMGKSTQFATNNPNVMNRVKKFTNVAIAPVLNESLRETAVGLVPVKIAKLKIASK